MNCKTDPGNSARTPVYIVSSRELAERQVEIAQNAEGKTEQATALALAAVFAQLAFADSVDELTAALHQATFPELLIKKCIAGFSVKPVTR
jgi:hypothetical protein